MRFGECPNDIPLRGMIRDGGRIWNPPLREKVYKRLVIYHSGRARNIMRTKSVYHIAGTERPGDISFRRQRLNIIASDAKQRTPVRGTE